MNKKESKKEVNLTVILNGKQIFKLDIQGSPELIAGAVKEFNSTFGLIYSLKETLGEKIKNEILWPKKLEKKQII